jgi:hypothetical protein
VNDHDEIAADLKREWFGRRAQQIHGELTTDLNRYIKEIRPERMRTLLQGVGVREDGSADPTAMAAANTAATAEGILVAVAMYLARREANTPAGD